MSISVLGDEARPKVRGKIVNAAAALGGGRAFAGGSNLQLGGVFEISVLSSPANEGLSNSMACATRFIAMDPISIATISPRQ